MSAHLRATETFDVLIDDDGKGEAADLVGLKIDGDQLMVTLVHCKYAGAATAGGRLDDLYEVCGQAVRSAKWRRNGVLPLLDHLHSRARKYAARTGVSRYEVGNAKDLFTIRERARQLRPRFNTIIAQPGFSIRAATDEHLYVLAGAHNYVQDATGGTFTVYCSK